ncbi:MAG: DMT family transporter [Actinomycetota bacterium]|nr:DMT family transporter [Actinomycetota bacterium]
MNREALLLSLSAAVLHATWNFAAKRAEGGGQVFIWGYVAASALLWVPVTAIWSIWHPLQPSWIWLVAGFVSGMLHVAYGTLLQNGYAAGDMNLVYPLARGTGPLLTVLVAVLILRQHTTVLALAGVALVVAGVLVISFGRRNPSSPHRRRVGIGYGVATGASIAAYTLWDAHAVTTLGIPALPYFTLGLLCQCLGQTPGAWRRRATFRARLSRYRHEIVVVAVLSPLAYVFVLDALTLAPVSVVAPVRESSIVVGALLSWLVLREAHPARRLAGSVVVLAGVAALALS